MYFQSIFEGIAGSLERVWAVSQMEKGSEESEDAVDAKESKEDSLRSLLKKLLNYRKISHAYKKEDPRRSSSAHGV